ncbi:DEAD/DEAH box helicase domain-containing protein [Besnoitia besnoiti]|uniref:RNA helicase n=1 Tax=Besnoitia besnoiti TaxID=94643 RepID=A0A2A9M9D9_BESBE|nr:DEAD/DEAH box helicase domain-containing protein [Besnoitia besnoiti]PFH33814.1 DEAD/DEAH box helicase domain-containing protein [Besnoitia besnoiti]
MSSSSSSRRRHHSPDASGEEDSRRRTGRGDYGRSRSPRWRGDSSSPGHLRSSSFRPSSSRVPCVSSSSRHASSSSSSSSRHASDRDRRDRGGVGEEESERRDSRHVSRSARRDRSLSPEDRRSGRRERDRRAVGRRSESASRSPRADDRRHRGSDRDKDNGRRRPEREEAADGRRSSRRFGGEGRDWPRDRDARSPSDDSGSASDGGRRRHRKRRRRSADERAERKSADRSAEKRATQEDVKHEVLAKKRAALHEEDKQARAERAEDALRTSRSPPPLREGKEASAASPTKRQPSPSPSLVSPRKSETRESTAAEGAKSSSASQAPGEEAAKISRLERFKALQQLKQSSSTSASSAAAPSSPGAAESLQAPSPQADAAEEEKDSLVFQSAGSKVAVGSTGDRRDTRQPQIRHLGDSSAAQAVKAAASAAAAAVAALAAQTLSASGGKRAGGAARKLAVEEVFGGSREGAATDTPKDAVALARTAGGAARRAEGSASVASEQARKAPDAQRENEADARDSPPGDEPNGASAEGAARREAEANKSGDAEKPKAAEGEDGAGEELDGQQGAVLRRKLTKAKARKQQQMLLLRTLEKKAKDVDSKSDDPLDAFMTALEAEAKAELDAAKEEERGNVAELRCLNTKRKKEASAAPQDSVALDATQSISLDEISRWEEIKHQFLPVKSEASADAQLAAENGRQAPAASSSVKTEAPTSLSASSASSPEKASEVEGMKPERGNGETPASSSSVVEQAASRARSPRAAATGEGVEPPSASVRVKSEPAETGEGEETAGGAAMDADAAAAVAGASEEDEGAKDEDDTYYRVFMEEMKKKKEEEKKKEEAREQRRKIAKAVTAQGGEGGDGVGKKKKKRKAEEEEDERVFSEGEEEESSDDEDEEGEGKTNQGGGGEGGDENLSYFDLLMKVGAKKQLPTVDHEASEYPPIKKNLYIQVKEISCMKEHEVDALRKTHGNIKVRGKQCPRPVTTFFQCGLPDKIVKYLTLRGISEPFPIQMQAIPCLMCGRDVIAVAETGSGKTLAYTLPLIRHVLSVKQQYKTYLANKQLAALEAGGAAEADKKPAVEKPEEKKVGKEKVVVYKDFKEGTIGLVIAPTRELCVQIFKEINRCCNLVDLSAVACYGGAGIGSQLGAIKRGVDVMVGTPGRLIDILTMNGGRVTSLKRVTFIVLDEADRMFDFGFEPQVTAIISSSRPDRQTCLFSATFPPHIEALARRILQKPVEIIVGEKGRTAANVQQYVEIMEEERKFFRLLQLLGEWQEHGSIIIFVNRQVEADELFTELLKYGYQAATLHGGQDQTDREFTIQEFQDGVRTLLIATSVAARGLDCKHCVLVINMTCPNHIEDYVHRIGRTGRAGRIGVAYTFVTKDDADKADDLEKALIQSGQPVPQALTDLSAQHKQECNLGMHGKKKKSGGGFGGRGFSFSASEKSRQQRERQQAKKELGLEKDGEDEEYLDADLLAPDDVLGPSADAAGDSRGAIDVVTGLPANFAAAIPQPAPGAGVAAADPSSALQSVVAEAAAKAAYLAQRQAAAFGLSAPGTSEGAERARVVAELLKRQDEEKLRSGLPPPPPGAPLPPSGAPGDATTLSIPQQAERMAHNAVQHIIDPIERARHFAAVKQSLTNYLTSSRAAGAATATATAATGLTPGQHQQQLAVAAAAATAAAAAAGGGGEVAEAATQALELLKSGSQSLSASMALHANLEKLRNMSSQTAQSVAAALAVLSPSNATLGKIRGLSERGYKCPNTGNFVDEFEINDYPQIARYKFTQRDVLNRLMEETGAVLYVKGQHVDPKEKHKNKLAPGAKYLHVEIIGATPIIVQRARSECRQLLEALAVRSLNTSNTQTARAITGRYNIWS